MLHAIDMVPTQARRQVPLLGVSSPALFWPDYEIEAELNEQVRASRRSTGSDQLSMPSQVQIVLMQENMKIALCVVGGVVLFIVLLVVLR